MVQFNAEKQNDSSVKDLKNTDAPQKKPYAPINVNPVGGECGQGVGIWQILKFLDQIPQGGKRKVYQSVKKAPTPGEKI